jgi:hypothetical protein
MVGKSLYIKAIIIFIVVVCSNQRKLASSEPLYKDDIRDGDLIFQTSLSEQSKAIQIATKSKYSHCGLIFKEGNDYYVYEAVQPVKRTALAIWIARGKNKKYVIKRLKYANQILTPAVLAKIKQVSKQVKTMILRLSGLTTGFIALN